ncbi:MAG: S41 family peptidase [Bdellovibrionota bacterium]
MKTFLLFISLCLLFTTSCSHIGEKKSHQSPKEVPKTHPLDPDTSEIIDEIKKYIYSVQQVKSATLSNINGEQRKKDVTFLRQFLPRSYGGYDYVKDQGFNWDSFFSNIENIEPNQNLTTEEWQQSLATALSGIQDSHFAVISKDKNDSVKKWSQPGLKANLAFTTDLIVDKKKKIISGGIGTISNCKNFKFDEILNPTISTFSGDNLRPIVLAAKEPAPLTCIVHNLQGKSSLNTWNWRPLNKNNLEASKTDENIFSVSQNESGLTLVKLSSLYAKDSDIWQNFIETAWKIRKSKIVILDLRGNQGGNSAPLLSWLQILRDALPDRTATFNQLNSAWTKVLLVNFFTHQLAYNIGDDPWQEHCHVWRDKTLDDLRKINSSNIEDKSWDTYITKPTELLNQVPTTSNPPFAGKLIILTDRHCASACELGIKAMTGNENNIIVGENTNGMAVIGENGEVVLPGSFMRIRWGQWIEKDLSNGFEGYAEGSGFTPKYWVDFSKVSPEKIANYFIQ